MSTTKAPTKNVPAKKSDKTVPAKPAAKPAAALKPTEKAGESKMDKAVAIFKRMAGKPRKEVIEAFIAEAGLTKAGSGTYYQNIKKKHS